MRIISGFQKLFAIHYFSYHVDSMEVKYFTQMTLNNISLTNQRILVTVVYFKWYCNSRQSKFAFCILLWKQDSGLSIIRVLILDFTCSVVNLVPSTVVVDSINRVVIHLNIHKKIYKWDCFKTLSLSTLFMNLPPFCLVLLILFLFQLVFSF